MLSPTLPVQVILEASLDRSIRSSQQSIEGLHSALLRRWDDLLRQLGVPGSAELRITVAEPGRPDSLPLTLQVNQRSCDYSWEMARRLYCYVSGAVFDDTVLPREMSNSLSAWASQVDDRDRQARVIELICLICVEAIKLKPSVLLGREQLTAYQDQLIELSGESSGAEQKSTSEWLEKTLGFALDHKLSIAASAVLEDSRTVAELLLNCRRQGMSYSYAGEELMDALIPGNTRIEIHFAPDYLREVTETHDKTDVDGFFGLRQAVYDQFGLSLPWFKFVENPGLKPRSFALGINSHVLTPWIGLTSRSGLSTTNSQLVYLVSALSGDLRSNLDCIFPRRYAEDYVSGLDQAFPTLVRMVKERFNQTQRARVLRNLLADKISLRNLRSILEWMLDYEGDPDDLEQFDTFVRAGIAPPSREATRGILSSS